LVADCEKQQKKLADLTLEEFQKYSNLIESNVYEYLGAMNVAGKYVTEGSAGPKRAKEQIEYWNRQLGQR
jgi:argininosuccinate lyase